MLQIYDTLTQTKRPFTPIHKGKVNMYVCGVTVYDFCHIGHARTYVAFDIVYRYLKHLGYEVNYVRNITDIDDKIINRANEQKESWQALTERMINAMHEDFSQLHILLPTQEPRATQTLNEMFALIQRLLDKGYAYVAENGDVYYAVERFKSYGALSKRSLDDLQAGARVDVNEAKHQPLDFVLWKKAKPNEPSWESPWGAGRPGWHIECSAMAIQLLGNHFDIHGGGHDLQFPHHENERAQSEAATGETFVNFWMHGGFVQVNNEKMAKSLGNFFTIRDVLEKFDAEAVRYFLISSHYRSPINYSTESLQQAHASLSRLYGALRHLLVPVPELSQEQKQELSRAFYAAMDDDFNLPVALAALFDLAKIIQREREQNPTYASQVAHLLQSLGQTLGILMRDPEVFFQGHAGDDHEVKEIEALIEQRNLARQNKDWQTADAVRKTLLDRGIVIEDGNQGTTWRKI